MKKIFGKKGTAKPPTGDAAFYCTEEKSPAKESEFRYRDHESQESCISTKDLTSENLKHFNLCFDNPDFSERDSNIFSINSHQSSVVFTSRSASGSFRQRKESTSNETIGLDDKFSLNEVSANKLKTPSSQKTDKRSKSHDSLDRLSYNILLKKTDEISDFNFEKFNEMNVIKEDSLQCAVERLVLTDEKRPRRSDPLVPDTEMNLFSELDLNESQTEVRSKADKKFLSFLPFRSKRAMGKSHDERQDKKKDEGFWSKKSFFNKARIVNFLLEKNDSTSKKSEFTQLNVTAKEEPKPKLYRERFVTSEVPLEEDLETKQYFKDLLFYIIYLIFLTTIAMSMVSANVYYFTNITASLFMDTENYPTLDDFDILPVPPESFLKYGHGKTLRNAHTIDDFWDFAESTMIELFYWKFYFLDKNGTLQERNRTVIYENQVLGVPRIRQLRVTNNSCLIHLDVKKFFKNCYYYYSPLSEDTEPIKEGMEKSLTATAWVYTKPQKLKSSYYWGEISIYGGGGYYLDLSNKRETSKQMIKELKRNQWISKATRALFIDFSLYNANINLFCLCKIVLEFPPVGGIIPKADFQTLKLIRYLTKLDFFILGCEFLLIIFTVYFTWKLIEKMSKMKLTFFLYFWSYIEVVILGLLYAFIVLDVIRYLNTNRFIETLDNRQNQFINFDSIRYLQIHFNNVIAVLLFLSWVKLLMYFTFNLILLEFKKTLEESFAAIVGFLPMFLVVFFAFAFMGHLMFGNEVKSYSTVWSSVLSLLQAFSGEFHYKDIEDSNQIIGPIFCVAFIFFIFFIFLNVFVAITNNAYAKIKSDVTLIRPRVGEYTKRAMVNLMTGCRPRKKLKHTFSLHKKIIFKEIKQALENAGFTKDEIKIFYSKYKINISNVFDEDTRTRIMEDLELRRIDFKESGNQNQITFLRRRVNNLSSRIENMEISLLPVIDKVDVLLDRSRSKKHS